jgi:hypothetical protein
VILSAPTDDVLDVAIPEAIARLSLAGPNVPITDPQGRGLSRSALEAGRPIEFITGDGTRPDRVTVFPATAAIDTPRPGATVRSGFTASGRAQLFEAAGMWVLYRYPDQPPLARASFMTREGAPAFGAFSFTVNYPSGQAGPAVLELIHGSLKDGTMVVDAVVLVNLH